MKINQRITDIQENGNFNLTEVEQEGNLFNSFKSDEYYLILHFTDEEIYYTSDEEKEQFEKIAEDIINTEKGIIFCFQ
jgi:hypothetical protein